MKPARRRPPARSELRLPGRLRADGRTVGLVRSAGLSCHSAHVGLGELDLDMAWFRCEAAMGAGESHAGFSTTGSDPVDVMMAPSPWRPTASRW